jgi:osmotically-inducible protein OsmY
MSALARFRRFPVAGRLVGPLCVLLAVADTGSAAEAQGPAQHADTRLEERIQQRLAWDKELAPFGLQVEVTEGIVRLSGSVSTSSEDHRARRIAEEVKGVAGVVNAVRVDSALIPLAGSLLDPPDDATLQARVIESISGDGQVQAQGVEAHVDQGRVILKGRVGDVAQRERAEHITRSLYGVQSVQNEIEAARP